MPFNNFIKSIFLNNQSVTCKYKSQYKQFQRHFKFKFQYCIKTFSAHFSVIDLDDFAETDDFSGT